MKKTFFILAGLGVAAYMFLGNKPKATDQEQIAPATGNFLADYNNKVVVDAGGYWFLVKDGKLHPPKDLASLQAWEAQNPPENYAVQVSGRVWEQYAQSNPEIFGASF